MRSISWSRRVAAALAMAVGAVAGASQAGACQPRCDGYGYPAVGLYDAPAVYSYSYYAAALAPAAYGFYSPEYGPYYRPVYARPAYYGPSYYTARVNIFRGPRWDYSAAYYNPVRRARWHGYAVPRGYAARYRGYVGGPIIRASRRW